MFALVITLSILLVLLIVVVAYIIIKLLKSNRDLSNLSNELRKTKTDKQKLQDMLKVLQNKPSMIGISYKTNKEDVNKIMDDVSNVFNVMRDTACSISSSTAEEKRAAFIAELQSNSIKTTCADIKLTGDTAIDNYTTSLLVGTTVSSTKAEYIKNSLKTLIYTILDVICTSSDKVGSTINIVKLDALLKDVFDAICTNVT